MSDSVSRSIAFSFSYNRSMSADVNGCSPISGSTDAARRVGVCDGVMIMLGGATGYDVIRLAALLPPPLTLRPVVSGEASRDPYALCVPEV
jgi:hypothetical protein